MPDLADADTRDVYLATVQGAGFRDITVLEESAPYPKGAPAACAAVGPS